MSNVILLGVLKKTNHPKKFYIRINSATILEVDAETKEITLKPFRGGDTVWDRLAVEKTRALILAAGLEPFDLFYAQQVKDCLDAGRTVNAFALDSDRFLGDLGFYRDTLTGNAYLQRLKERELLAAEAA